MKDLSISKAYTIYTGTSIKKLILRYVLLEVLLGSWSFFLAFNSPFLVTKNALMVSVIFISALGFSVMQAGVLINATKADCYLQTFKQRRKTYLTVYFTTYFAMIFAMLIFLSIIYLASAIGKNLIENAVLCFLLDIESVLLYFAIAPFIFTSKSMKSVSPKNLILLFVYILVTTIEILKPSWIVAIVLLVIVPGVGVWSNKHWIKSISEVL